MDAVVDELFAALSYIQITSYVDGACLTLLTYDALLNISQEYRHIWKSKWSLIKCLYLWSRYGAFLDTTLTVLRVPGASWQLLGNGLTAVPDFSLFSNCNAFARFNILFSIFGIGVTEIILMIRTYALYGHSRKVLGFCMGIWLSVGGLCTWAAITWADSLSGPAIFATCDVDGSSILVVCFLSLLAGETVIVLLTLWKFVHYKEISLSLGSYSSRLIASFYRDGIMFYLVMLLSFVVVVVFQRVATPELKLLGLSPLRVIHSILACQLVIHVRAVASEDETNSAAARSFVFAEFPSESDRGVDTVI